jgi:hypothetical protein
VWWARGSTALLASVCLHGAITAVAAVLSVGGLGGGGAGAGPGRELGMDLTLTAETRLEGIMEGALGEDQTLHAVGEMTESPDELPSLGAMDGAGGVDAPASGEGLGGIADGLGGAGGDIGDGDGLGGDGAGGAGGGGSSFFGVEAKGSRILYICDISGSMVSDGQGQRSGARLQLLQRELSESITALQSHMSFYVLFFNSDVIPIADSPRWIIAGDKGKRFATQKIAGLQAFGGTEPWGAFEIALAMRPAPDAVYFMTDGAFDPQVAVRIKAANVGSRKIPIHTITLGEKAGEETMRQIAADSGGTYTHVPDTGRGRGGGGGGAGGGGAGGGGR